MKQIQRNRTPVVELILRVRDPSIPVFESLETVVHVGRQVIRGHMDLSLILDSVVIDFETLIVKKAHHRALRAE